MSYDAMKKRWPHGWRDDADAMVKVREHGRREHSMPHMNCPVCVRFWPLSPAKRHHDDDLVRSVLRRKVSS